MNKQFNIFAVSFLVAASVSSNVSALDSTMRQPGVVDKRIELPDLPPEYKQGGGRVIGAPQAPSLDDFTGNSNRQLPMLSSVTFNGSTVLAEQELSGIGEKYLDRPITEADIAQLKFDITKAYAEKGNILVKVTTPSQNLTNGILTVNIYEGKVGRVIVEGNAIASYVPEAFAHDLAGKVFDERAATEVVNDLNEILNTNSSITLKPGLEPVTTDIVLQTKDQPGEDENYIGVDNYGSKFTGQIGADLHLEKSNALGLGEKLGFDGKVSEDKLWSGGVNAKIPTGVMNTYAELGYSYSSNEIGDRLSVLDATGESHIGTAAISGNLINNDFNKLTLRSGLQVRNHKSELLGSTESYDRLRKLFVEASYLGLAPDTLYLVNGKISKGFAFLGGKEQGEGRTSRLKGDPEAVIFEPTFFLRHNATENDFLKFFARGQYASDTLVSSDLFALGGYGSVRGFEPGEETGEHGITLSGEYQHKFDLAENFYVEVGPWVDYGYVNNEITTPKQTEDTSLLSAGLGANFGANIIPAGETTLRLDWAHPIGDYKSIDTEDNSYYFRLQQNF